MISFEQITVKVRLGFGLQPTEAGRLANSYHTELCFPLTPAPPCGLSIFEIKYAP